MRISTTSEMNASWTQAHRSGPSRLNGERPYTQPSRYGREIRLGSDMRVNLGSINGKPLFMTNTSFGGFFFGRTGPVKAGRPGEKVSQEVIKAARLASSYSRDESEYAHKIATVVNGLYRLAKRTNLPLSIQGLNDLLREHSIDASVVADALRRLGVNANEMFSVNGQKMHVSDGQFILV